MHDILHVEPDIIIGLFFSLYFQQHNLCWLLLQGTVIGLDLTQLTRYSNINKYFVGSGEYYDGARTANDLRQAALYLSIVGFFLTAITLILTALTAACKRILKLLTASLVCGILIRC